jgi:hypothetical protein
VGGRGSRYRSVTGVRREHRDLDVGFFRTDLPELRGHLAPNYDLWSVGSGLLRQINHDFPDLHPDADQVWFRRHAWSPWLIDLLATADADGHWVHKRNPEFHAPLDEVTWADTDGIRYLTAHLVLAMKAKNHQPRDADFIASTKLLAPAGRARLRNFLRRRHPKHEWLTLWSDAGGAEERSPARRPYGVRAVQSR